MSVPQHVAIILDGNGRWAKAKGMPRTYGHAEGAKNVDRIIEAADELGIKYVTMYCFSTENWKRAAEEVSALMKLLERYIRTSLDKCLKNNIRMRFIGDTSVFTKKLREGMEKLERETAHCSGITMIMALNYGSRDEIKRAVRKIVEDKVEPEAVTEELISSYLDTKDFPDPDLMIRTSGELRLSNFLMWQLSYAEFYFTEVPWPEFSPEDLKEAVDFYMNRDRRFGGVK